MNTNGHGLWLFPLIDWETPEEEQVQEVEVGNRFRVVDEVKDRGVKGPDESAGLVAKGPQAVEFHHGAYAECVENENHCDPKRPMEHTPDPCQGAGLFGLGRRFIHLQVSITLAAGVEEEIIREGARRATR